MSSYLSNMMNKYQELESCIPEVQQAFVLLETCFRHDGQLLVCGNGGSASDSEHIVGELMKGFMRKRPVPESFRSAFRDFYPDDAETVCTNLQGALPTISLVSQSALNSAFVNDVDPELVFAQQVYGYGRPGDTLLALSTSGNSRNVIRAIQVAKAKGMTAIGMTGADGGAMKSLCDVVIRVPFNRTPDIQERHLPIYHTLCLMLEEAFF